MNKEKKGSYESTREEERGSRWIRGNNVILLLIPSNLTFVYDY
jgi:hypothetical protein